jgi:hypothetical protein
MLLSNLRDLLLYIFNLTGLVLEEFGPGTFHLQDTELPFVILSNIFTIIPSLDPSKRDRVGQQTIKHPVTFSCIPVYRYNGLSREMGILRGTNIFIDNIVKELGDGLFSFDDAIIGNIGFDAIGKAIQGFIKFKVGNIKQVVSVQFFYVLNIVEFSYFLFQSGDFHFNI